MEYPALKLQLFGYVALGTRFVHSEMVSQEALYTGTQKRKDLERATQDAKHGTAHLQTDESK